MFPYLETLKISNSGIGELVGKTNGKMETFATAKVSFCQALCYPL
jgi:hypothetical protein